MNDSSRNIAYIFSCFPALSEHSFYLEIEGLRQLGWNVHIFTLREGKDVGIGTEAWNKPEGFLHHESFLSWGMWLRVLRQCARHPLILLKLYILFLKKLYSTPVRFTKTLATTAKALAYIPIIKELDIRIIHGPWGEYPSVAAYVIHRMCPRIVFTMSLVAYDYDGRFPLIPDMVEASNLVFTISKERKIQIQKEWPRTNKPVTCVYHGVQLVMNHNEQKVFRQGIITVGQLLPYKGFHVLVDAMHLLQERGIDFRAKFIGGDSSRNPSYGVNLRRHVRRLGLTNLVEFTGPLPHDQVMQALSEAELFVLPSLYNDVLPNVVKEALSLKVPVIVTPTVGIGELVQHKQSGLIVPKDDPVALADAITWALQNPEDMRQMAFNGNSILTDRFDIAKTSVQRSNHFEQLLAART